VLQSVAHGRRGAAFVLIAALLLLAPAAAARAAGRQIPSPGPLPVVPADFPDRVITGPRAASVAGPLASAHRHLYATPDGGRVEVAVSRSYPPDAAADQALVNFLAGRLHGSELGRLRLFVGKPAEVSALCGGGGAIACYAPDEERMYVPGEESAGVPMEYAITHEYGHHLASWRSNRPWSALDWGPKYWASEQRVCAGVRHRVLFPGDQGSHYFDDPGEGFADSYAHLYYPAAAWRYNPLMRPDTGAFGAIRRDVLHPWHGPRTRTLRGRRARTMRIRLHLDGDVRVRVRARRGSRFRVVTRTSDWAAGRRLRPGRSFGIEWCRRRATDVMTVSVERRAGAGRFALKVSYPG
jgi:hypothetical protein